MNVLPDPDELQTSPLPRRQSRRTLWARVLITTLLIVVALAFMLDRALPGGLSARLFPPTAMRASTPTTRPTATPIIPTPLPAAGLVPPPPTNCPTTASYDSIIAQPSGFTQPVQLFGRSPVWIPQGFLPQNAGYLDPLGTPEPYPQSKIIWAIGPTENPEVMARVTDIQTGELAWWTGAGGTPATPTLDIPAGIGDGGWASVPTAFTITRAGCYRLDVTWQGGSWYLIFAAGGDAQSS